MTTCSVPNCGAPIPADASDHRCQDCASEIDAMRRFLRGPCPKCHETRPERFNRKSWIAPALPSSFCDTCHDRMAAEDRRAELIERATTLGAWAAVGLIAAAMIAVWIIGTVTLAGWLWGAP